MFELLLGRKRDPASTTAIAEPEPDPRTLLLETMAALDTELDSCEARLAAFKVKHMALINGSFCFTIPEGADLGATRIRIEQGWRDLLLEREVIQRKRNSTLAELARL